MSTEKMPAEHLPDDKPQRQPPRIVMKIMGLMAKMAPPDPSGENSKAVRAFRRVDAAMDLLRGGPLLRRLRSPLGQSAWPVVGGEYRVGQPTAGVAVCTLSSNDLIAPASVLPGVAIAGRLYTVNLGIERMVQNIISNPRIRALVLCGKDSPVFHTAQGVRALLAQGVDGAHRIIGAEGHLPVLANLSTPQIARFRAQITLVDAVGVTELADVERVVSDAAILARDAAPLAEADLPPLHGSAPPVSDFKIIQSGGHREPLAYDPRGFFVITVADGKEIVCRHYNADNTPGHEIRARSAERIALALVRENLISQMSHAAYLGGELAKAETALHLGLTYEQDRKLTAPAKPQVAV
ncbi:MAG: DUF4346 domain-containing protein [Rhodospirillaceae bacterium]|nr:DUF4346 domain-containing protein [Rhodospirillaceae bacterium]